MLRIELKGFTLSASMRQICAADGGPCPDVYNVITEVSRGDVVTATTRDFPGDSVQGVGRVFVYLKIGNETVTGYCDKELIIP